MSSLTDSFYRFQDLQTKLLVSCPKDPTSPGGLFVVDFAMKNISKILEADCRGIARCSNGFYIATNSNGILKLDDDLNIIQTYDVPALDLHGMKLRDNNLLYVVETSHNAIGIYQTDPFERIDEIKISPYSDDQNHINDIWLSNSSIYVSMFSLNGGWKDNKGSFDGVIAEYHLQTKELIKVHIENLQLPHSVTIIDNEILFCESLQLSLNKEHDTLATLGGYTRGLDFDGWNFYIGQSEMRHLSRILSIVPNVSIDCGIHIFDTVKRTNRFLQLPAKQVYEIMILNKPELRSDLPESIHFNQDDALKCISINEWHDAEEHHRWMAAKTTTVKIFKNHSSDTLIIDSLNAFPGLYKCSIFVNQQLIGMITYENPDSRRDSFNISSCSSGPIEIAFVVDLLWSPSQQLNNTDTRNLGMGFKYIGFS
ncbi:MAG: DUF4915 domain-containing protein [Candidatus Pristimantibacillus sp.]